MQTTQVDYRNGPLFPMILRFSIPAAISLLITAVYNIVDRIFVGNWVGTSALAGLSVCFPLSYMMMAFGLMCSAGGISQGIQPILGNNYGSGNYKRVMQTFYQATALSVGITCLIWVAVLVFPKQILAAFGGTQEMFDIGVEGLRINFCITPVLGFVMLATTFFQSINRPVPSVLISLLRQVLFLVPFLYLLPLVWQINGIFFAQPISDLLATLLSLVLILREQRRMYAKLPA